MFFRPLIDVLLSYIVFYGILIIFLLGSKSLALFVVGVILLSLAVHRIGLFVHAASHHEFHRKNPASDLLYIVYCGWFLGVDIKSYRQIHSLHHLNHGTPKVDPEDSYSNGLFFAGIPKAMLRLPITRDKPELIASPVTWKIAPQKFTCIFTHIISLYICFMLASYYGLAIYFISVFFGCQAVVYLRNCLEHTPGTDNKPISRNFKEGFLSFFLGAAGFAKHGLHHQMPGKRYWMLPSCSSPTTYAAAFREASKHYAQETFGSRNRVS